MKTIARQSRRIVKRKASSKACSTAKRIKVSDNLEKRIERRLEEAALLGTCGTEGNNEWLIEDGLRHLLSVNRTKWGPIIAKHDLPVRYVGATSTPYFHNLLRTIVYQQLAGKAASTIHGRVMDALGVKEGKFATPTMVANAKWGHCAETDKVTLNNAIPGLSNQKTSYIQSLAEHFCDKTKLKDVNLDDLADDVLLNKLVAVKGLGKWSVEMFMVFTLRRKDVFSSGDLVLRQGVAVYDGRAAKTLHKPNKHNQREASAIAEVFAPFRSLASWYMWRLKDTSII